MRPARRHRSARSPADESTGSAAVLSLDRSRIERALSSRTRYKYVKPAVVAEAAGWKIVSPNCSRSVDASGGAIDIAWFEPEPDGAWRLHARDHQLAQWRLRAAGLTLPAALALVLRDPEREFWP
jgi:hypothetical protein